VVRPIDEKTGRLVTESNWHWLAGAAFEEWEAANAEYEMKPRQQG
jgi:hypothetical protein